MKLGDLSNVLCVDSNICTQPCDCLLVKRPQLSGNLLQTEVGVTRADEIKFNQQTQRESQPAPRATKMKIFNKPSWKKSVRLFFLHD